MAVCTSTCGQEARDLLQSGGSGLDRAGWLA